ncbi:MAG: glycogen synthase [Chloroflexota bacterium]
MRIAVVASEAAPFSKTGGLADVTGALFREYEKLGHVVYLFVPLYRVTKERVGSRLRPMGAEFEVPLGRENALCTVYALEPETESAGGAGTVFLIGNDRFFDRDGLYGTAAEDYGDNDRRFAFFCKGVAETCRRLNLAPDILHCHDWQTALIPLYLKTLYRDDPLFSRTKTVFTIHNLGYQGHFPALSMEVTGLGWDLFRPEGIEFYGKVNFLKAGLIGADVLTTVSETYAEEILTPEFGFGLDGLLRKRSDALFGIVDGIDYTEWDPSSDGFLPETYRVADLTGKSRCKKELMRRCGLKGKPSSPLLCFIGRLAEQKGIGLLSEVLPDAIGAGALFVVIGTGEQRYVGLLGTYAAEFPGKMYFHDKFDEPLAHLAYAGSDIFLMPSLYEPCGLGQMIAMRYGSVPVARKTGGSADTISHVGHIEDYVCEGLFGDTDGTGFLFADHSGESFGREIRRAMCLCRSGGPWKRLMRNGMSRDFSWERSAQQYLKLYERAAT